MNHWLQKTFLTALVLTLFLSSLLAQEWQWSVPVGGVEGPVRAFLWIPPGCRQVRGLVVAQHNMEEISILENPVFRREMSKLDFAETWVAPSPNLLKFFDFSKGAAEVTNAYLDSLATRSGYSELKYVPIVGLGHSAAASWPYYFGALNPGRTLACVSVSGQWPYFRSSPFAPDIWKPDQNLNFIPCLETMGEYEAAATWANEGLKERQEHPLLPLSMLAVPGEGHFASSDRKAAFIAFYIQKAAQYRLPKKQTPGKPVVLRPIDPTRSGWLADRWRPDGAPTAAAAPVGRYQGNAKDAFWYFDEETVREVENYGRAYRGLKPQLVGFVQNGALVPQKNTHIQLSMPFLPKEDGISFSLQAAFYDTVPAGSPRLPSWAGLPVGAPIGHSKDTNALFIERICGPFQKISDTIFRLQLDRSVDPGSNRLALTFAAKHPGDAEYKPAVQQGEIVLPAALTEGTAQTINFPPIANQKAGIGKLQLRATSDAGIPVNFYLLDGPAELDGNVLTFTKIPPRTRFPVAVTVVAWQYGRAVAPKIRTAVPVVRTFYLTK